ncbi:glycosyltransferase family 9 protein [Sphingomonas hengshuiensis]|uniref:Heptosyltransferase n=1 Tax=Sphingomonas hengshuiensis TaxID=1609977 RepID=A0A7U5HVY6_9SPHN|nr:hypothetical protein [Sphingomonas hengshuiensis]AJP74809.1 hypothetical protein TS85_23835 [Sphingomonas hengshuiensis]
MTLPRYPVVFLQYRALGDFVIAAQCLGRRRIEPGSGIELLAGEHLRPIAAVLDIHFPLRFFAHPERAIPAIIALRSQGMLRGLKSAILLKGALHKAGIPREALVIFEKLDKRERFLAAGFSATALPHAENIYLAHDAMLDALGLGMHDRVDRAPPAGPVRIYPGSRLPERHVPFKVVAEILDTVSALGLPVELMLLEGERPDLETTGLPFTRVPRTFEALIASIKGARKVISADSMPAHLAEYLDTPIFVCSPTLKSYWLPRSAFTDGWTSLFDEGGGSERLRRFLAA